MDERYVRALRDRRRIYAAQGVDGPRGPRGAIRRWRARRRYTVAGILAPAPGSSLGSWPDERPPGWPDGPPDDGGAGVREPRRPLPQGPSGAAAVDHGPAAGTGR